MSEIAEINLTDQDRAREAAKYMDWGVVVDENQGGVGIHVVALNAEEAAAILRAAADALSAK